jgi:hypothetical protein
VGITDFAARPVLSPIAAYGLQLLLEEPDLEAESGRGLMIVASLSDRWGVEPARSGKAVWFSLALSRLKSVSGPSTQDMRRRSLPTLTGPRAGPQARPPPAHSHAGTTPRGWSGSTATLRTAGRGRLGRVAPRIFRRFRRLHPAGSDSAQLNRPATAACVSASTMEGAPVCTLMRQGSYPRGCAIATAIPHRGRWRRRAWLRPRGRGRP